MFKFFVDLKNGVLIRNAKGTLLSDLVALDPKGDCRQIKEMISLLNWKVLDIMKRLKSYDLTTYQHSLRVCALMARANKHPMVLLGALLHDCGKLQMPKEILTKTSPLTEEEYEKVKEHPLQGVEIALEAGVFNDIVENCILKHHEVFGEGYFGFRNIPEYVTILGMMDIFDAITSDRPYAAAEPKEKAIRVLSKGFNTEQVAFIRELLH